MGFCDDRDVIVCFDLRYEKFTFIHIEMFGQLIDYKGKLAVFHWEDDVVNRLNLNLWALEDVEKQEWSKYAYTSTDDKLYNYISIVGETTSGEIVFSTYMYTPKNPFYVSYFNPERETLQHVEIHGFGEAFKQPCRVLFFVNHIENLDINDLKLLKAVHAPLEKSEYVCPSDSESD
ncbi:F-box protein At2g15640-like [Capsella rubella]|uniref:F-box protein At2g15640-like n=1 Tax=Capsella rubella TaxID=81985 RepID=UPI000CD4E8AA|nr:F-box protein At2g15640-like [Capsella rubella]